MHDFVNWNGIWFRIDNQGTPVESGDTAYPYVTYVH